MSWVETVKAAGKGGLTSAQFNTLKAAMERLEGSKPEERRTILAPMFEDARYADIAELALLVAQKLEAAEALAPFPKLDVPAPKRTKKAPPAKEPEAAEDDAEDDEDPEEDMRDEDFDDELSPEEEADRPIIEEEEEVPRRRRTGARQQLPTIVVQAPRQQPRARRLGRSQAVPQRRTLNDVLPSMAERFRVYVRNEDGTRDLCNEYDIDDIGSMSMQQFITDYVDPEYAGDAPQTRYEVNRIDPRTGRDLPNPTPFTITNRRDGGGGNDPFSTVERAVQFVNTMKSAARGDERTDPMLREAQHAALQKGDFQSMFMLMMMDRMGMGSGGSRGQEELLLKVMDRLDAIEGKRRGTPDFGAPAPIPPMPMMMAPPPPPAGESKILDVALSRLASPPPSLADTMREVAAVQQVMGGGGNQLQAEMLRALQALTQEVAQLKSGSVSAQGNLESAMANFEKLTAIAKSVTSATAPAADGGGGIGSALQKIITPKLGEVLGNALAGGIAEQQAKQQQQMQAAQSHQQQVAQPQAVPQPQPPPRDPNLPPSPPPRDVQEKVKMLRVAQTHEARVERFLDVIQAMFLSGEPYYQRMLEPAMAGLQNAEKGVEYLVEPRRIAFLLAAELLPPQKNFIVSAEFVDAALAALAARFAAPIPPTLVDSRGKWTVDATGQFVPLYALQPTAQPMAPPPAAPQPPPPPAPTPAPPQLVASTVTTIEPAAAAEPAEVVEPAPSPQPAPIPLTEVDARPTPRVA